MELNQRTLEFVEKMGLMFDRLGATRTAGRMMGLLLVANEPLSLAAMADLLQVSKPSMSTNARIAEQIGLAQRVSRPGDRRDYYEITPGSFERMVSHRVRSIDAFITLTEEGLGAIDEDNSTARARLTNMKRFYEFFRAELEASLERWKALERGNASRGGSRP